MTDITKCSGEGCGMKEHCYCYRYTAKEDPFRQSYFLLSPVQDAADGGQDCEHLWYVNKKEENAKDNDIG